LIIIFDLVCNYLFLLQLSDGITKHLAPVLARPLSKEEKQALNLPVKQVKYELVTGNHRIYIDYTNG
jgi:hypothetical protein